MKITIELLLDKRFGWRFKLANLIMGDRLRNYLAVGVLTPLRGIVEDGYISRHYKDDLHILGIRRDCEKMIDTVNELMKM